MSIQWPFVVHLIAVRAMLSAAILCSVSQPSCLTPCFLPADMRSDVQAIFKMTPHDKQVMMFSATLSAEIRPICKKFMSDVRPSPHGHHQLPAAAAPCALQQHTLHTLNLQAVAPRRPVTVMA